MQGAPGTTHCWSGRFYGPDGPLILPVTYQFRNGSVIFRTSPVGPLAGLVRRTNVAFEIDGFDEETKSGWSVLIRGFAEAVPHNYLLTHRPGSPDRCPGRKGSATCSLRSSHTRSAAALCRVLTMIRSSQ